MSELAKNVLVFIVVAVVMMSVFQNFGGLNTGQLQRQDYSDFLSQVRTGQIERVEFQGDRITYGSREPLSFYTISPETDNNALIGLLEDNNVRFTAEEPETQGLISQLLISSFPILLLIAVWVIFTLSSLRSFALLLPKDIAPLPPPPCICLIKYTQTAINNKIGKELISN